MGGRKWIDMPTHINIYYKSLQYNQRTNEIYDNFVHDQFYFYNKYSILTNSFFKQLNCFCFFLIAFLIFFSKI